MWPFRRKEERLTPLQWRERIAQEHTPITLEEYIAGCIARATSAQVEQAYASVHAEKILERFDRYMLGQVGAGWDTSELPSPNPRALPEQAGKKVES